MTTPRPQALAAAVRGDRARVIDLAETVIAQHTVDVAVAPGAASVMLRLDSPVGTFNLAEVVVTEAEVAVDGHRGWGSVMGSDEEAALACAVLDAAATGDVPTTGAITALCDDAIRAEAALRAAATADLRSTEVTPG